MNDTSEKSSEELADELQNEMPKIKSRGSGWGMLLNGHGIYPTQKLYLVAQLVLAQQQEIEQLKAELDELKKRVMSDQ